MYVNGVKILTQCGRCTLCRKLSMVGSRINRQRIRVKLSDESWKDLLIEHVAFDCARTLEIPLRFFPHSDRGLKLKQ